MVISLKQAKNLKKGDIIYHIRNFTSEGEAQPLVVISKPRGSISNPKRLRYYLNMV